jgi:squalene monooxygenase
VCDWFFVLRHSRRSRAPPPQNAFVSAFLSNERIVLKPTIDHDLSFNLDINEIEQRAQALRMPFIHDDSPEPANEVPCDPGEERRRLHHDADVIIVGAGILGSSLAFALGEQGRSVILLEKSLKEPDRIVGELLQPGGVEALEKLGLRQCLEGIDAIPVKGYEVIYYGNGVKIPYPDKVGVAGAPQSSRPRSKPEGRSFHHGRFVSRLRSAALSHPNVTVVETEVISIVKSTHTLEVLGVETLTHKTSRDYFFGSLTVIADGYASKFRKSYLPHTPKTKSKFWGLELIDAQLPLPEHGHVILGDGAPVLLYQIGTRETRALVDIPDNTPTASLRAGGVKAHLQNVVLPSLPEQVQPSFAAALEKGALRSMPNSFLPSATNKTPGLILLGDAMNMRHPLTGGGMTVALNDVVLLRHLLSPEMVPDFADTKSVLRQMRTFHWQRKSLTAVINILAQALYSLFAANDPYLKYLQMGCFRYFQFGGQCIDGPAGLLACIVRRPFVLFYHFFSVALLSIWIVLTSAPGLSGLPGAVLMGYAVFFKACTVLFPYIFAELRS